MYPHICTPGLSSSDTEDRVFPHPHLETDSQLNRQGDRMAPVKLQLFFGAPGWLSRLSLRLLVLAQVMISLIMSSSPASGSAQMVQSLLRILFPSLSVPPLPAPALKINK